MNFSKIFDKLLIPIMAVTFFIAINEQSNTSKNIFILIPAMAFFIFGMIKLSAKTPSKNQENQEEDV